MSIIALLLNFIGGIFSEVIKDVLKTPATTSEVSNVAGDLPLQVDSVDSIIDRYDGVFDRS